MPFAAGLVLTPVGAIVATFVFLIITYAEYATKVETSALLGAAVEIVPYGLLYGSEFFVPIALVVLPLTYLILRRYKRLSVVALVVAGLAASILLMWSIILLEQRDGDDIPFFSWRTLNFSFIACVAGAAVGLAFAAMTRWWRPFEWPGYWSRVRTGFARGSRSAGLQQ